MDKMLETNTKVGLESLVRRVPKLIGRGYLPTSLDSPYVNLFYHTLQGIVVVEVNSTEAESLDSSLRIHMAHPPNRAAMHCTNPHMQNFLRGRREILKRTMTFPGPSSQYITGKHFIFVLQGVMQTGNDVGRILV
ncbi:hypothetical protein H109_02131 [Trichophyton interdigitale MR816]|uniref:Uncharacterized protein n=1 Tax=Trichophyton interdigitale (strain MR816) TaxID=1215338 RepID=A0A059JDU5_TRIIM|nr:hypothetical protein H101_05092 [Trichophyton interdigitale H6]KDB26061.1 hypothetical protein H109_02131 [Trichophyton interdigitale MR816]